MNNANYVVPNPVNEKVYGYDPGSNERLLLKEEIKRQSSLEVEVPLIIGGEEVKTGNLVKIVSPHDHKHVLGHCHMAGEKELKMATEAAMDFKKSWAELDWQQRASIFLKMAELITIKYRYILNAATMLNQSKNVFQAEIDSTCELADFLRFNSKYMEKIYSEQPESSAGVWNRLEYRALEGFILAITPFNFTAIAGNLVTAPAMMGNTVVWKPATTALLSGHYLTKLYKEAGLPDGVVNFVPTSGKLISENVIPNPNLAGVHFTGSTDVFKSIWQETAKNIDKYVSFPRIVGETGGKDFVFMHKSASANDVAVALVRGSYEYQGQKCSAASRAYIPASRWEEVKTLVGGYIDNIKTGDVKDFSNLCNAVIDEKSFDKTMQYLDDVKKSNEAEIVFGGNGDKSKGYFIEPTLIKAKSADYITMKEELFAPVLTVFVYDDDKLEETLALVDDCPYALTGAIFGNDRFEITKMANALVNSAGNFYINDKPTGAVVGQQPFGGSRGSGTNDKAGSYLNLIRWSSPRTIKETFVPAQAVDYPFMIED